MVDIHQIVGCKSPPRHTKTCCMYRQATSQRQLQFWRSLNHRIISQPKQQSRLMWAGVEVGAADVRVVVVSKGRTEQEICPLEVSGILFVTLLYES